MMVWLDDEVFAGGSEAPRLLSLCLVLAHRGHSVVVKPRPQATASASVHVDGWLRSQSQTLQRLLGPVLGRPGTFDSLAPGAWSAMSCAEPDFVVTAEPGRWRNAVALDIELAVRVLGQPLRLLVENLVNDGAFILRTMPPRLRAKLVQWIRSDRVAFENGGGVTVLEGQFRALGLGGAVAELVGMPPAAWRRLRFPVFDSDGNKQDLKPANGRIALAKLVDPSLRRVHRWRRRDAEHYIPRKALESIISTRQHNQQTQAQLLTHVEEVFADGPASPRRCFGALIPGTGGIQLKEAVAAVTAAGTTWPTEWFEADGAWPEFEELMEKIEQAL